MFLLEEFPTSYMVGGLRLKIDTDFRTSMRFEMLMQDEEIDDETKMEIAIKLYFGEQYILNYDEAINAILDFYTVGSFKLNKATEERQKDGNSESKSKKAIYSFEHDGKLFYSSFLEQYGIDLTEIPLHWWKFRALFEGLSEDTKLSKVMGYRAVKIPKGATKEERNHLNKMKKLYALPDMRSQEEKERDFGNALF